MIHVIRSEERYVSRHDWLTSRFSFSFADYYDPSNMHWGALRVLNDDTVQGGTGFGMHQHRDMEIISYVIEGALEHKDSMGNHGVIRAGEVQRITAGTGIYHSEYNHSETDPVHFLQIWVMPNQQGLTPSYSQKQFTKEQQRNRLLPVVSGKPTGDAMQINQDATFYLSNLEANQTITHRQPEGRRMHLFVISGSVSLGNDEELQLRQGDAARIKDTSELTLATSEGAEFLLIDLS